MCKAILIAFIDDAARRIVYARFVFSEESIAFEKGIRHMAGSAGFIQIMGVHSYPGRPGGF